MNAHIVSPIISPRVTPYPLSAVDVADDSVFAAARGRMLDLARNYPVDRLLAVFRANAQLDTRGARPPGNWEDHGHPKEDAWSEHDYPGREEAQTANLLRGHYAGHFLSMLSLAHAATGEEALKDKVTDFVAGLGQVQDALAATGRYSHPGFLAAYGEWQFSRLEGFAPYGEIWAPYYTTHKIMAGLLDAYELTGNEQALRIVTKMGQWVHARLSRLDPGRRQKMWSLYIAGEYGGMNETLARLAAVSGQEQFLTTATYFDQENLLEAGRTGTDILDDMHANQHVPQLIGYVHEYELTGEQRYLEAAVGIFAAIVPGRMYAHGGTGESELWGPANTVAGDIGNRNAETCVAYNLVKLARLLFTHTLDPSYLDYVERAELNQILGSRKASESDVSPEVTYMFPVHAGARREYDNIGTCCGGTGLENHVKYGEGMFHRAPGELWIHHLFPARLDRAAVDGPGALNIDLVGDYPLGDTTRIRFTAPPHAAGDGERLRVHLRIPAHAAGETRILLNGEPLEADAAPGGYLSLEREWSDSDEIVLQVPLALRSVPTIDDPAVHSMELGPTVLLARSEETTRQALPLAGNRLLDGTLRTSEPTQALVTRLADEGVVQIAGLTWEPAYSGQDTRYHMYVRQADATIAFAGEDSGVPNRLRPAGVTVLDSIWQREAFTSRDEFLDRVADIVVEARQEGVLGRSEAERVLCAAARADIDGDGTAREAEVRQTSTAGPVRRQDADGTRTVWDLPADWADQDAPPVVHIGVAQEPAPSGWYTSTPTVTVHAAHLDQRGSEGSAGLEIEYRVDGTDWQPYTEPFELGAEGSHRVEARVRDALGRANRDELELHVDTSPPETTATVRELGSSVEVTFFATDSTSGVDRIQWEGPGTFWGTFSEAFVRALTDTEQVLEYAATDRAGNIEPRRRLVLPALTDIPGQG